MNPSHVLDRRVRHHVSGITTTYTGTVESVDMDSRFGRLVQVTVSIAGFGYGGRFTQNCLFDPGVAGIEADRIAPGDVVMISTDGTGTRPPMIVGVYSSRSHYEDITRNNPTSPDLPSPEKVPNVAEMLENAQKMGLPLAPSDLGSLQGAPSAPASRQGFLVP